MRFNEKKKMRSLLLALTLCTALCFGVACNDEGDSSNGAPPKAEIVYVVNEPIVEMNVGDTFTLSVLNLREGESVSWRSLQAAIVSVDAEGKMTALSPGQTTVLATIGDQTVRCSVTVGMKLNLLPTLTLEGLQKKDGAYKLNLMRGDEYELSPALYLGEGEVETSFSLESSTEAVAIDGATLQANGVTENAQITISCTYESQTYTVVCYVTVEEVAL